MNAYIVLNKHANNGNALVKWNSVKHDIFEYYLTRKIACEVIESENDLDTVLCRIADKQENILVIAAGGDGTVNYTLNRIMNNEMGDRIFLGATGLGSSNDFHKPFAYERMIKNIPARINPDNYMRSDVGKVTFLNETGKKVTRYFIVNSSIGLTAEGNNLFNSDDTVINFLKSRNVILAIWVTFLKSLIRHKNIRAQLFFNNGEAYKTWITNLGIIKKTHFTGNLKYDTPIFADDGNLGVNLIEYANMPDQLKIFHHLEKGIFSGLPKTKSWLCQQVSIDVDELVALETDGEVFLARGIEYSILPRTLKCLN